MHLLKEKENVVTDKIKILHIEYNPIISRLVQEMLSEGCGISCEIEHFSKLSLAIARLLDGGIDVILTDFQLPDSKGINTFQQVHATAPQIPIVIMTGTYEEEGLAIEAIKQGAQDYLRKSEVSSDSLIRSIRYSIERQNIKNELRKAYSDLMTTQEQLIQSEKLAGLARFSEGIAHEVRNPIGIIIGGAELLEKKLSGSDEEVRAFVGMIKTAAIRASDILKSFLVYAKTRSETAEELDLRDVAKSMLESLKKKNIPSNINVVTEISGDRMCVEADKNQIDEAIRNICNNSLESMPDGGTITIKMYKSSMPGSLSEEPAYVIEIIDTGMGIADEDKPKLFEPFFTTKVRTTGKGRGLFISKTIVEFFGGKIVISSAIGKGTDVKIALPCCKKDR